VLNCGSATLKFDLFAAAAGAKAGSELRRLASGQVERIGAGAALKASVAGQPSEARPVSVTDHHAAVSAALEWLNSSARNPRVPAQGSAGLQEVDHAPAIAAGGHRVVHGGDRFGA